jgi:hypothetical protein
MLLPCCNGDVLDNVGHKNIKLSNVIVSDILDSDHLQIIFHVQDNVGTKDVSAAFWKFTDWERFRCLDTNLISPKISSAVEADKVARAFTASTASAYSKRKRRGNCNRKPGIQDENVSQSGLEMN